MDIIVVSVVYELVHGVERGRVQVPQLTMFLLTMAEHCNAFWVCFEAEEVALGRMAVEGLGKGSNAGRSCVSDLIGAPSVRLRGAGRSSGPSGQGSQQEPVIRRHPAAFLWGDASVAAVC